MNYSKHEHDRALDKILADMDRLPTRKCIQCGEQTTGSVWADKQVCKSLCQRCKTEADAQALRTLEATARGFAFALPRVLVPRTKTCPVCNGLMTHSPAEVDYGHHTGFNRISTPAVWGCENCEHKEHDDE